MHALVTIHPETVTTDTFDLTKTRHVALYRITKQISDNSYAAIT